MLPIKNHEDLFLDLINLVQEPDSSFIKLEKLRNSFIQQTKKITQNWRV